MKTSGRRLSRQTDDDDGSKGLLVFFFLKQGRIIRVRCAMYVQTSLNLHVYLKMQLLLTKKPDGFIVTNENK